MTTRVSSVFNLKYVPVAFNNLHCHAVYTYGSNSLVPLYFALLQVHFVAIGLGLLRVRCRASDGSCGRVMSVFVSFSGLHESEQLGAV